MTNNVINNLWVEKYRPRKVSEIVQQNEIKLLLEQAIKKKKFNTYVILRTTWDG